jgi:lipid-A-disaccharide synthase
MPKDEQQLTFFLVAGEASGDLHGAKLMEALKHKHPGVQFLGLGGDQMIAQGLDCLEHVNRLAIMGFTEVIKHLPDLLKIMKATNDKILSSHPDRIILIDYPGFNLKLAKKVHNQGIPLTYFILPQLWAWKPGRIKYFQNYIDQALSIFPFEESWFKSRGVDAIYVGHPFSEEMTVNTEKNAFFEKHSFNTTNPLLTLLPGSRQQEISRHWSIFLETVQLLKQSFPDLQIVVGKAPSVTLPHGPEYICVEEEEVRACLKYGTTALVASGTATLEAAVLGIPMVVCYKLAPLSASIIKRLNQAPFASIVNLIAGQEIVPEYLQYNMKPEKLATAIQTLLTSSTERDAMLAGYDQVRKKLGEPGVYERAATAILGRTT